MGVILARRMRDAERYFLMWSKWIEGDRMNILGPSCKTSFGKSSKVGIKCFCFFFLFSAIQLIII